MGLNRLVLFPLYAVPAGISLYLIWVIIFYYKTIHADHLFIMRMKNSDIPADSYIFYSKME